MCLSFIQNLWLFFAVSEFITVFIRSANDYERKRRKNLAGKSPLIKVGDLIYN